MIVVRGRLERETGAVLMNALDAAIGCRGQDHERLWQAWWTLQRTYLEVRFDHCDCSRD